MGLLQILLILVWAPTAALIAFVATTWLSHGVQAIWSAVTRPPSDAHSSWPLVLGGVAALAGMVGAVITFPNQAVMRHAFDKLLGYGSTRVEITLRQDDAATRNALVQTLRPFMEIGGREIRYRVSTRHGSYTETDEVPSYYRFVNGRLEIATGGVVGNDRLSVIQPGFKALAQFSTAAAIDASVAATVSLGKARIAVQMLPRTAMLVHGDAAKELPSLLRPAAPARCHLEVQALFSTDAFRLLMFAGRSSGALEIHAGPDTALRDTQYQLLGMGLVPGSNGRSVKELETDATRIYGVLRLLPPGLNPDVMDCDTALGRMTDPALVAAAMLSTFPDLSGRVDGIEITPSSSFSPWHHRGWTAVPPGTRAQGGTRAEAGTRSCSQEQYRYTRASLAMIEERCMERDPQAGSAACARVRERLDWSRSELARCTGRSAP
ncbi:hypothetical protein GL58_07755 [Comamonas testosteroni]|uniref:Uncharacterized protein n=1 Tax=Comamonas testosteroni TaxID=285 RepID=A0A0L7MJ35_COMTE|nr:hypothetical protein [Comamonas testosteroni]KOC21573.1 hypothetical protein GL58_07755 [Comamonas testosteroni]KWT71188.1 hypothetical protein APV28_2128 [Comamonas testosteroni]